jgi:hypothetical protein
MTGSPLLLHDQDPTQSRSVLSKDNGGSTSCSRNERDEEERALFDFDGPVIGLLEATNGVLDDEDNYDPGKHFRSGQEIQNDERELTCGLRRYTYRVSK